MKLEQSFEVSAPIERVWDALIDVERVAPCLPGAEVTGRNDDGSYNGSFKVKIGPTAASYSGKLQMEQVDEGAHTATMQAQGTDRRGQGGAKATIVSSVVAAGEGAARVEVVTDYHITGRLARFGRGGMIEEISHRLLNEFARNLQEMLAGDGGTAEVAAGGAEAAAGGAEAAAGGGETADVPATSERPEAAEAAAASAGVDPHAGLLAGAESVAAAYGASAPAQGSGASEPPAAAGDTESTAAAELGAVMPEASAESQPAGTAAGGGAPAGSAGAGAPPPPARESEPIEGLSLLGSVLVSRIKKNPAPAAGALLALFLLLKLIRRGD